MPSQTLSLLVVYAGNTPPPGLTTSLFQLGYTVVERPFTRDAPGFLSELAPAAVVAALDPSSDSHLVLLRALSNQDPPPILALSTAYGETAVAAALDAGATACLPADASAQLIAAQLRALGRAASVAAVSDASAISVAELTIDLARRRVSRLGRPLDLTRTEFDLLAALVRNAGRVLSPVELASSTGQYVSSVSHARGLVKAHMSHLRQKLGQPEGGGEYITTIRGVGYLLDGATVVDPAPSATPALTPPHRGVGSF